MGRAVTVAAFGDAWRATLVRNRLQEQGIAAVLADEHFVTWYPYLDVAVGGIKVQVLAGEAERALALLAESVERDEVDRAGLPDSISRADDLAQRAWRATFFCFVAPLVFHAAGVLLVVRALAAGGLSVRGAFHAFGALALLVIWIVVIVALMNSSVGATTVLP